MIALILTLGLRGPAEAQVVVSDLAYESPGSTRNRLDVILPAAGLDPRRPTIVYIHGGSWNSHGKEDDLSLYVSLAQRGYGVVACNYTLAVVGAPAFPQAVQDVKNVIRWVRLDGQSLGLSPMVIVTGPSAGGHLAMMAAMTSGDAEFETLSPPPGGYRPQAFVSFSGPADLEWHVLNHGQLPMFTGFLGVPYAPETADLYRKASPIFHVRPCDPPGMLIHGTNDTLIPHGHSVMMAEAMQLNGIFTQFTLLQGAGHAYEGMGGLGGAAQFIADAVPILMPAATTADLDGDTQLTVADFTAMLKLFAAGDMRADINRDGNLNVADFTAYLQVFARGC